MLLAGGSGRSGSSRGVSLNSTSLLCYIVLCYVMMVFGGLRVTGLDLGLVCWARRRKIMIMRPRNIK